MTSVSNQEVRLQTRFVAGSVFLLAVGFFLVKIGRDALFIQERGVFDLPKAYLGIALLAGPVAGVVLTLMRILGVRTTRLVLSTVASLGLLVFSAYIRPGGGLLMTGFFIFVPLVWGVLYTLSWLLAGELLDGLAARQVAKSYGLIGGAAILGGLVGGLLVKVLADELAPSRILWLAAAAVAASGVVLALAQRRWPAHMAAVGSPPPPTMMQSLASVLRSRFGVLLLAVGMAAGLVGVLLEFQFYLAAAGGVDFARSNSEFFANVYIVLNGGALLLQILVLPRLHKWIGVGGALLILPLVLTGGAGGLAAGVSLVGISSLRVAEGGLKSSLHRPNWEQAYLLLSGPERSATKLVIDGFGVRLAEGLAAGFLYWWLLQFGTVAEVVAGGSTLILGLLLACSLVWLLLSWVLRVGIRSRSVSDLNFVPLRYDVPLPDG